MHFMVFVVVGWGGGGSYVDCVVIILLRNFHIISPTTEQEMSRKYNCFGMNSHHNPGYLFFARIIIECSEFQLSVVHAEI